MVKSSTTSRAFSLVELSIVLVILGLLVGGVLSGQSLIHAAELNSITEEYGRWITATNAFQDKYNALPGDMANATSFWGVASAGNCALTSTGDARTCNGDGNGQLDERSGGSLGNEEYRYWQQLANAGLIEGNLSGIRWYQFDDGAEMYQENNTQAGYNSPRPKMANSSWSAVGVVGAGNPGFDDLLAFNSTLGKNVLVFGQNVNWGDSCWGNITPADAWNIDKKIDDGKPAYGKVQSQYAGWGTNCTTGAANGSDLANAVYNLTDTDTECFVTFTDVF